jgi:hypothetical protein
MTCLLVEACAALPPPSTAGSKPLGPHEVRSAQSAAETIAVGRSTKADVRAALGEGVVVDFGSGYEVWVYREPPSKELVLLFDPSGTLTKTRIR